MISEDIIQKVKEQNNIVDVISETVKLKKSGRNYFGLCPFHHEKSPSFSVSPDKQIYKCFGCGEAGNVVTFVMKLKNLPYPDAIKLLAERVNIEIELDDKKGRVQKEANEKLYKINVEAARYFFYNLRKNNTGKAYFLNRGIPEATINRFGLGFSLDSWNGLLRHLKSRGYTELDILSAGLIIKSEKGNFYDRFRNRVIFPVFDYNGKVIGFGGRVLDNSKPKYLNSPETAVFKKGTNLYGLNFAAKNNSNRTIIMVEGYMDCISLHQHGITNAVASLGTALTVNQAKLLKRYADRVIISYDADLAGQSATMRGLEILKKEGFDVRVLTVPQGKDPDEYIRNNGSDAFLKLMENALPLIDYRIKRVGDGVDFNNKERVIEYVKNVTDILAELDPVEKDVYIKKISEETGIKEQAIYDLLNGEMNKNVKILQNMNIVNNFGQKLYLEPAYLKAEKSLLKLMVSDKEAFDIIVNTVNVDDLILMSHKKIFNLIISNIDYDDKERQRRIEAKCDDIDSSKEWISIMDQELIYATDDSERLIKDYIKEVKKFKLEESKKDIMNKIKIYESKGLLEQSLLLAQKLIEVQKEIGKLQE